MTLGAKQKRFVDEYLIDFNATQAAIRAGYSEKTARAIGCENLTKPDIKQAVAERVAERTMTADETLIRLGEQARAEYSHYMTPQGVDIKRLIEDGKGHLIKGVKKTPQGQVIEFYDAQTALLNIAKHHGLLTDKLDIKIEAELDALFDLLERNLDSEVYDRILSIIQSNRPAAG